MGKQPTPQGISALLRNAGFDRSVSESTRIRGFRSYTEGFKVSKDFDGGVEVEYRPPTFRASDEREREMLDRYRKAIEAAGYTVKDGSTALTAKLLVTAKEA